MHEKSLDNYLGFFCCYIMTRSHQKLNFALTPFDSRNMNISSDSYDKSDMSHWPNPINLHFTII